MGPSDLLQNASKTKPAVKSQRLTGRIITTGAFSSVTLLLLQPGSLTHLRHLLLLACNSIWSSHASVKGLKPWLWPWGYTTDQNMKRKRMHQLSMKPSHRALFAFNISDTQKILCHYTILQELILMLCLPNSQLALSFLPLSLPPVLLLAGRAFCSLQLMPVGLFLLRSMLSALETDIQAKHIHAGAWFSKVFEQKTGLLILKTSNGEK